jgi:hypothetical protein
MRCWEFWSVGGERGAYILTALVLRLAPRTTSEGIKRCHCEYDDTWVHRVTTYEYARIDLEY